MRGRDVGGYPGQCEYGPRAKESMMGLIGSEGRRGEKEPTDEDNAM
jgi:hypothetical protein